MVGDVMEGGCLCGKVRYRLDGEPLAVVACHCRNCQKQSGSALSIVVVAPRPALHLDGALKTYEDRGTSGQPVHRRFCPHCGSPVLTDTPAAEAQGLIFIKGGTADEAQTLAPSTHYWTERAHGWIAFPDTCMILRREETPEG